MIAPIDDDPFADGGAAPQRTQLAWHRTALALIGVAALAARALFRSSPVGGAIATGVLAVLAAVAVAGGSLPPHLRPTPGVKVAVLSAGTTLAALVTLLVSLAGEG